MACRYNLVLKDLNLDRRRYGRYGKPGEKKQEEEKVEKVDAPEMMMPPATSAEPPPPSNMKNVPAVSVIEEEKPEPVEKVKDIIAEEKPEPVKDAAEEDIPPEDK